jgi:hypothetical protein
MGRCLQLMILNKCGNERLNETNSGSKAAVVLGQEIGREWLGRFWFRQRDDLSV